MRSFLRVIVLPLGLILLAGNCGGDSTSPSEASTFSGTLTGDRTGTKAGPAYMINTNTSFEIVGGTGDDSFDFEFSASTTGLPTVGTHQIGYGASEFYSSVYLADFALAIDAASGTVTIATATASRVTGSFSVTYTNADETFVFAGTFSVKPCGTTCPG